MLIRVWRFITLVLVALAMGMTFAHTLELPAKMDYSGPLYVKLQNTLYVAFGPPIGGFIVGGAVLMAVVLAFLVRKRRISFYLTLAGAVCLLLAFPVVFFAFTEPANVVFENATPRSVPADWMQLRARWEYSHAASFVLNLLGFGALVLSVLVETPVERSRDRGETT